MNIKFLVLFVAIITSFVMTGCLNSLSFDQNNANQAADASFENQLSGFQKNFAANNAKKDYETNRIFSNDFPVTYRAKKK